MLDQIVARKKEAVEQAKRKMPLSELKRRIALRSPPLDFSGALKGSGTRLIAEIKKASPSKGLLCPDFRPVELARAYAEGGAAAISVLTEVNYFQGSLDHLAAVRQAVKLPLLRKDFIFDPYQVYESAAFNADALLLIVAILTQEQLKELLALSHSMDLRCLVEAHNEKEVKRALDAGAKIVGINNRDLATFKVDINTTAKLKPLIPAGHTVVSESGIHSRGDVEKLKGWGVNAVLDGQALVTAGDVRARLKELIL
ncbi:MAG: indole-3-glycerol phosphate synthase TrpC [Dehalococcoidales bacterium]|nr:indole-3-glycerol phosphate synthase TrpC [Dehalococcoidales bacterium]